MNTNNNIIFQLGTTRFVEAILYDDLDENKVSVLRRVVITSSLRAYFSCFTPIIQPLI